MRSILNKRAALELSIGTIVIVVLAMTMLILGLVLVRNIFSGATASVDSLNDKVVSEINNLFAEEGSNIVIKLGADQTAKVKQGTMGFKVAIGARKAQGGAAGVQNMRYRISVPPTNELPESSCVKMIGLEETKKLFRTPFGRDLSFDRIQGDQALALIEMDIPEGVATCSQKVYVEVIGIGTGSTPERSFFILEIQKRGFFS